MKIRIKLRIQIALSFHNCFIFVREFFCAQFNSLKHDHSNTILKWKTINKLQLGRQLSVWLCLVNFFFNFHHSLHFKQSLPFYRGFFQIQGRVQSQFLKRKVILDFFQLGLKDSFSDFRLGHHREALKFRDMLIPSQVGRPWSLVFLDSCIQCWFFQSCRN